MFIGCPNDVAWALMSNMPESCAIRAVTYLQQQSDITESVLSEIWMFAVRHKQNRNKTKAETK